METSFSSLKKILSSEILETINEFGFESMTPVQTVCIPLMLERKDIVAEAITGSGKTLAFLIPMIQIIINKRQYIQKHDIFAIIISPTRDLARQTYSVLKTFLNKLDGISSKLITGGSDSIIDMNVFLEDGFNIIIGTPGKLRALLENNSNLQFIKGIKTLEMLILDEADQLLDMGFKQTIDIILKHLPKQRRTSLFTATQSWQIDELIRAGLRYPVSVLVKNIIKITNNESITTKHKESIKDYDNESDGVEFKKKNKIKSIDTLFNNNVDTSLDINNDISNMYDNNATSDNKFIEVAKGCSINKNNPKDTELYNIYNKTFSVKINHSDRSKNVHNVICQINNDKVSSSNVDSLKTEKTYLHNNDENYCVDTLNDTYDNDDDKANIANYDLITHQINDQRTPSQLKNFYMICNSDEKFNQLISFLKSNLKKKNLIFLSTCACVNYFSKLLTKFLPNHNILSIHSKKRNRKNIISKFKNLKECSLLCTDVMGRGIDVDNIDTVLQYDPPSSASNFVHRCGRTARIGRSGCAIVFLRPHEDTFIEFIRINQKVPLKEMPQSKDVDNYLNRIIQLAKSDRSLYENGLKAFVSLVQSYSKHDCNLIFRLEDLDLGLLATGLGLLHLPRMPEIKCKKLKNFEPIHYYYDGIPYLNKYEEKQRILKNLEGKDITKKQIESKTRTKKLKHIFASAKLQKKKRNHGNKDKDVDTDDDEDRKELLRDTRLIKKLKLGKISKEEFDTAFDC